jgi:uncharacterized membrane protein YhaH (DUF805 family)
MNPFSGSLNRLGFLLWSLLFLAIVLGFGASIDATKSQHVGEYWLPYRILFVIVFVSLSILIFWRRIQNAGLSYWFMILWFIPLVCDIFWISLFFIPPATHHDNKQEKSE